MIPHAHRGAVAAALVVVLAALAVVLPALPVGAEPLLFLSTQLTPAPEATMMRQVILKGFDAPVDFEPYDRSVFLARTREMASTAAGPVVLGATEAELLSLHRDGLLAPMGDLLSRLSPQTFLPRVEGRVAFDSRGTWFVPWMQATYLMAANVRALPYLPRGANLDRLTYDELREWAAALYRATGKGMLGFPIGPKGLMNRFLEGYLYPSFTGSMSDSFSSAEAESMWIYFRGLCQYTSQSSLILNRMDEALLNGEVWVAWDHSARLVDAFRKRPADFVAFPAPVGPRGRGIITVLAGLGVPRGSPPEAAAGLIEFLTGPTAQARTMESVGFLPVVSLDDRAGLSPGCRALVRAAAAQIGSPDSILGSLPALAADSGRRFDLVYLSAFSQIVLQARTPGPVLQDLQKRLLPLTGTAALPGRETRGH